MARIAARRDVSTSKIEHVRWSKAVGAVMTRWPRTWFNLWRSKAFVGATYAHHGSITAGPHISNSTDQRRSRDLVSYLGCVHATAYWPIAVWSTLATSGEGRLSLLPARPKAASSGGTRRSSMMAASAP